MIKRFEVIFRKQPKIYIATDEGEIKIDINSMVESSLKNAIEDVNKNVDIRKSLNKKIRAFEKQEKRKLRVDEKKKLGLDEQSEKNRYIIAKAAEIGEKSFSDLIKKCLKFAESIKG